MFGHRRQKSRNVEEDSLVSKKTETKRQLSQKLKDRPEPEVLEERGILPKDADRSKGSRKGSKKDKKLDGIEKRKSSMFLNRRSSSRSSVAEAVTPIALSRSGIGMSVVDLAERDGVPVPKLVELCIAFLQRHGFEEAGIFRISGDKTQIDKLVDEFEKGHPNPLDGADVNAVTSLLKLFFRQAPAPLFTFESHTAFLSAVVGTDDGLRIAKFVELLKALPVPCLKTIMALFPLLRAVADRSDVNMMTPNNLGIVFGPTLLRSVEEVQGAVDMTNRSAYVVEFLINHWPALNAALGGQPAPVAVAAPPPSVVPPAAAAVAAPPPSVVAGAPPPSLPLKKPPPPAPPAGASLPPPPSIGAVPPQSFQLPPPGVTSSPVLARKAPPPAAPQVPAKVAAPPSLTPPPPPVAVAPPPALPPGAYSATALYNFAGDASKGQINLTKGEKIVAHVDHPGGWTTAEIGSAKGFVPTNYIKKDE